jgi:hypothetical protein
MKKHLFFTVTVAIILGLCAKAAPSASFLKVRGELTDVDEHSMTIKVKPRKQDEKVIFTINKELLEKAKKNVNNKVKIYYREKDNNLIVDRIQIRAIRSTKMPDTMEENIPPRPNKNFVWKSGYWKNIGDYWYWTPGHWKRKKSN